MSDKWKPAPDGRGGLLPPPDATAFIMAIIGKQAPGAIPNGARIRKIPGDANDRTPMGTLGTVNGSMGAGPIEANGHTILFSYVVTWDGQPDERVFLTDFKIERAT